MHNLSRALDSDVIRQVPKTDKILRFSRVQDNPNRNAPPIVRLKRIEDDGVSERVGCEVGLALNPIFSISRVLAAWRAMSDDPTKSGSRVSANLARFHYAMVG